MQALISVLAELSQKTREQLKPNHEHTAKMGEISYIALWARINKNTDWSTGSLAHPFAHSLARLTHSALLASLARSTALTYLLTLLTPSLVGQWMIRWLFILCFFLFWPIVHRYFQFPHPAPSYVFVLILFQFIFSLSQVLFWYHLISDIRMAPSIKHSLKPAWRPFT